MSLSASSDSPFENYASAPTVGVDSVHVWLVCAQVDRSPFPGYSLTYWNAIGFLGRLISSNPDDVVAGRRVGELYAGPLPAGNHAIPWTAPSAPGPFFVRVTLDGNAAGSTRVVFLR
jgi:hypothetical protein